MRRGALCYKTSKTTPAFGSKESALFIAQETLLRWIRPGTRRSAAAAASHLQSKAKKRKLADLSNVAAHAR